MAKTRNLKPRKLRGTDHISFLPDDILLCILSKLKVKEQARTSVLSTRWANLWMFAKSFNIDAFDFFGICELILNETHSEVKTLKFINTADQILSMHRGQSLDEIKIRYPIGASETLYGHLKVDGWIDIVKQKQVKALHLNFGPRKNPFQLLSIGSTTFSSLVILRLQYACLSSGIIHCLLSNCPNLLELSIERTYSNLQNLKISGSSIKLTHLELIDNDMDSLELFAPNLVSFSYSATFWFKGLPRIRFKNIPLLSQLSCSHGFTCQTWRDYIVLLPQLNTLTLTLSDYFTVNAGMPRLPTLENLKQMHVKLFRFAKMGTELCIFLGLLKASPYLCRLSLDLGIYDSPPLNYEFTKEYAGHKCVKEVEIYHFSGSSNEVHLLIFLARSCSSLQKIIIHPSVLAKSNYPTVRIDYVKLEDVESVVKELPSKLQQKELDILFVTNH